MQSGTSFPPLPGFPDQRGSHSSLQGRCADTPRTLISPVSTDKTYDPLPGGVAGELPKSPPFRAGPGLQSTRQSLPP